MMDYVDVLKREVVPALGCTEPIAVAYAAAWAASVLDEKVVKISVLASRNILKNAMSVGLPGCSMTGIPIAAALGALGGRTDIGLEVLRDISEETVKAGSEMVEKGLVSVEQKAQCEPLYVEVTAYGEQHQACAIIARNHNLITDLIRDGKVIRHIELEELSPKQEAETMRVESIWTYCMQAPLSDIAFLEEGIEMNLTAAKTGIKGGYGMSVGYNIALGENSASILGNDVGMWAVAMTAAACDARMAGASIPVMSVAGSGNQGLVCMLPVAVFAEKLGRNKEQLLRAVALSALITVHMKQGIGRLSALCGCGIAAAVGASCGILFLLNGGKAQMQFAIQNMVANITGMVCDGAKSGCAIKVATAVSAAVQCAVLAVNNVSVPARDGIVDKDVEKTIENLGSVGRNGMFQADQLILDMMTARETTVVEQKS